MARRSVDDDDDNGDGDGRNVGDNAGGVAAGELRQFIERIERLEEDKAAIQEDIKDVKAELKGRGYDIKAVNAILKMRKQDADDTKAILAALPVARGNAPVPPESKDESASDAAILAEYRTLKGKSRDAFFAKHTDAIWRAASAS